MQILSLLFSIIVVLGATLFLLLLISVTIAGHFYGAPFVPSKRRKIGVMLDLASIVPGEKVVDLGSGDGSVILGAARRGAAAVGVEINPFLVWFSRTRAKFQHLDDAAKVVRGNLKDYDLKGTNVVFIYLWPSTIESLKEKLQHELAPGARIVSNDFPINGWPAILEKENVYLYKIGT